MDKRTIEGIREYYDIPEPFPDEMIEDVFSGSFGEAIVNLTNAKRDFIKALRGTAFCKIINTMTSSWCFNPKKRSKSNGTKPTNAGPTASKS